MYTTIQMYTTSQHFSSKSIRLEMFYYQKSTELFPFSFSMSHSDWKSICSSVLWLSHLWLQNNLNKMLNNDFYLKQKKKRLWMNIGHKTAQFWQTDLIKKTGFAQKTMTE